MNKIKGILATTFVVIALLASQSIAFPPFVGKARKFGAKDCRFCHVNAEGGAELNARGKWLVQEKANRNADAVDPEWLVAYKTTKKARKK